MAAHFQSVAILQAEQGEKAIFRVHGKSERSKMPQQEAYMNVSLASMQPLLSKLAASWL